MEKIKLTIDGKEVAVPQDTTILKAALRLGIDIPTLCYEPHLSLYSSCRICVVEDLKSGRLVASCAMPCSEGMEIATESDKVIEARKGVLELILASHPLDCLTCQKTGECRLQDYCYRYQVAESPYQGAKRELIKDEANPFYLRDYNKCVYCGKCVRTCHEVNGVAAIGFAERGFISTVATPYQVPLEESTCVFCGMCVEKCPVGALMAKSEIFQARPWEIKKVNSVCSYCGVGCNLSFKVKNDKIIGVDSRMVKPNQGELCVKGKFGWDFIQHPQRLRKPLIRKNDTLVECEWEEALEYTAQRLKEIRYNQGGKAIGGLCSAKCTSEENYLFQKMMRTLLNTHNIDHCARL